MNLCQFGIHRWEKEEGGTLRPTKWRCKDCGTLIKERSMAKVYHIPEESASRIIHVNKKIMMFAAAGLLTMAYFLLKRR